MRLMIVGGCLCHYLLQLENNNQLWSAGLTSVMRMFESKRSYWLLTAVLLAAFALRIFRLDWQSLWWDEGISLHLAASSLAEIVRDRAANIHPPLYYFVLKAWVAVVGLG